MASDQNPTTRTVEDVLRDCRLTFSARTRYVGQKPRDDELLVAEIERLRTELAEAEAALEKLING